MMLVAGLGNPGPRYQATRHNVGFRVVDELARRAGVASSAFRERFHGEIAAASLDGHDFLLLRPMTFMNESGRSVQSACAFYKVKPNDVVVVHDELDLPFARLQLRKGGGDAGNRGIRSVIAALGADFLRLRVGIGRPPPDFRGNPADFVLQGFSPAELPALPEVLARAAEAVALVPSLGLEKAMNRINQR
jgi:PTH1 family peptidyl-tRNA hydrolase